MDGRDGSAFVNIIQIKGTSFKLAASTTITPLIFQPLSLPSFFSKKPPKYPYLRLHQENKRKGAWAKPERKRSRENPKTTHTTNFISSRKDGKKSNPPKHQRQGKEMKEITREKWRRVSKRTFFYCLKRVLWFLLQIKWLPFKSAFANFKSEIWNLCYWLC